MTLLERSRPHHLHRHPRLHLQLPAAHSQQQHDPPQQQQQEVLQQEAQQHQPLQNHHQQQHQRPQLTPLGDRSATLPAALPLRLQGRRGGPGRRMQHMVLPDDGFSWLKYGEKRLAEEEHRRAYFRCVKHKELQCDAKLQVEFTITDEGAIIHKTVYCNNHNHDQNTSLPGLTVPALRRKCQSTRTPGPKLEALEAAPLPGDPPSPMCKRNEKSVSHHRAVSSQQLLPAAQPASNRGLHCRSSFHELQQGTQQGSECLGSVDRVCHHFQCKQSSCSRSESPVCQPTDAPLHDSHPSPPGPRISYPCRGLPTKSQLPVTLRMCGSSCCTGMTAYASGQDQLVELPPLKRSRVSGVTSQYASETATRGSQGQQELPGLPVDLLQNGSASPDVKNRCRPGPVSSAVACTCQMCPTRERRALHEKQSSCRTQESGKVAMLPRLDGHPPNTSKVLLYQEAKVIAAQTLGDGTWGSCATDGLAPSNENRSDTAESLDSLADKDTNSTELLSPVSCLPHEMLAKPCGPANQKTWSIKLQPIHSCPGCVLGSWKFSTGEQSAQVLKSLALCPGKCSALNSYTSASEDSFGSAGQACSETGVTPSASDSLDEDLLKRTLQNLVDEILPPSP